jgi:hypothetical protein
MTLFRYSADDPSKWKYGKLRGIFPFADIQLSDGSCVMKPAHECINLPGFKEVMAKSLSEDPDWKLFFSVLRKYSLKAAQH